MVSSFGGGGGGGGAMKVSQVHNSIPSAAGGAVGEAAMMRGGKMIRGRSEEEGRGEINEGKGALTLMFIIRGSSMWLG